MAKPATTPDPHAVELDRLLDKLERDAELAAGLTMCAEFTGSAYLERKGDKVPGTKDTYCIAFLLEQAEFAAGRVKKLVDEVQDHLGANSYRPGGALHWPDRAGERDHD